MGPVPETYRQGRGRDFWGSALKQSHRGISGYTPAPIMARPILGPASVNAPSWPDQGCVYNPTLGPGSAWPGSVH
eukprot:3894567-Pyramimonas_sp.AAC.1